MKRVRVTQDAERDLDEIWVYIARDNIDAANRFIDELTSSFLLLGSSPRMGRSREELKPNLRSHPVGNYVIYYRETEGGVSIVHVVHGARDPTRFRKLL
jgi:toxin ParE1/3/4